MYLNRLEIKHDILKSFDPRARLAAGVMFILVAVNISAIVPLALVALFCLLFLFRDFVCVLKRLLPLELFCLLFFVQAVSGILRINTAVIYILRVNCAALLYILTVIPMGAGKLAQTLAVLKVNTKLSAIFYLSYRYIYMLSDRVVFSVTAMRLRSSACPKSMIQIWKAYAHVFSSAVVSALINTDKVTLALQKRGFDGIIPQTAVWTWRVKDTVLLALCCSGLILYGTYTITGRLFFL